MLPFQDQALQPSWNTSFKQKYVKVMYKNFKKILKIVLRGIKDSKKHRNETVNNLEDFLVALKQIRCSG